MSVTAPIAEYRVERVRAVPPSPGVDSAAVLRQAVAARGRRLHDGALLRLLLVFAITSPGTVVLCLMVALVGVSITAVGVGSNRRASSKTNRKSSPRGNVLPRRTDADVCEERFRLSNQLHKGRFPWRTIGL
jgi:hypothetical protein